jgi:hypothetical protein
MPRPSLSSRFYNPNNTWCGAQIIKLLIIYFSPLSCYHVLLINTLFSNTLSLLSSFNASDQVSHPYNTTS